MRVTDATQEYECEEITQTVLLCRGGAVRPHLCDADTLWGGAKPLPERRHAQRRAVRGTRASRRWGDWHTVEQDRQLATLDRKLRERRAFLRARSEG